jgi:hypothetical protein
VERGKYIELYPAGTKLTAHRIPGVTNFEGTLIHELTHVVFKIAESHSSSGFMNGVSDLIGFRWKRINMVGKNSHLQEHQCMIIQNILINA